MFITQLTQRVTAQPCLIGPTATPAAALVPHPAPAAAAAAAPFRGRPGGGGTQTRAVAPAAGMGHILVTRRYGSPKDASNVAAAAGARRPLGVFSATLKLRAGGPAAPSVREIPDAGIALGAVSTWRQAVPHATGPVRGPRYG